MAVKMCLRKMNSEDGQVYSVCIQQFSCFTKYNRMQSKHKQTICEHSRRNSCRLQLSQYTKQRIIYKDDIEFVTEFPCLLGHPVSRAETPSGQIMF